MAYFKNTWLKKVYLAKKRNIWLKKEYYARVYCALELSIPTLILHGVPHVKT